jgi:hypothetical protein
MILGISVEQLLTFVGIIIALGMGILNWYDKRYPTEHMTPLEESEREDNLNRAIALANKRALSAEQRAERIEELYEQLKIEFEDWIQKQNYKIIFNVTLGTDPKISSTQIYHDRRVKDTPFTGEEKRK